MTTDLIEYLLLSITLGAWFAWGIKLWAEFFQRFIDGGF